ncbi:MAG: hypothetical protein Q8L14_06165 [Myxococcales bacterium]|nr:hypothetical protein [Myxococcales bacterium]
MQTLLALIPLRRPVVTQAWLSLALFSALLLPATFLPAVLAPASGYTWSLLVFAVPSLAIARSLSGHRLLQRLQRPVLGAWAVLVPMGVVLNLLFADDFFTYPDGAAVSGLSVPAFDFTGIDWAHPIPLEEFAFYGLGFLTMLLGYAWADEVLLPLAARAGVQRGAPGWLEAALAPLALVVAGVVLSDGSTPSYWTYLSLVPLPVTLLLWPVVRARLNMPALLVTMAVLFVSSLVWEAGLAVPRGWWGYQPDATLGRALFGVPIEAVVVWVLAPVTTAVLFEALRLRRSST